MIWRKSSPPPVRLNWSAVCKPVRWLPKDALMQGMRAHVSYESGSYTAVVEWQQQRNRTVSLTATVDDPDMTEGKLKEAQALAEDMYAKLVLS